MSQLPQEPDRAPAGAPPAVVQGAAILVWSDIACPWAHLAVHRLLEARAAAGLDGELVIDHRPLPLEIVAATPPGPDVLASSVTALSSHEPGAGWAPVPEGVTWWPATSFAALATVQAARTLGAAASETVDRALRRALFGQWRALSRYPVVLEVVAGAGVDAQAIQAELRTGRPAASVWSAVSEAQAAGVEVSPTICLPDGTTVVNPGLAHHAEDGEVVVDEDDPGVYRDLVERSMAAKEFD